MSSGEDYQRDLNRYVDGEMSADEKAEFLRRVADDPARRQELISLEQLREVTDAMPYYEPPDRIWEGYWEGVYRRMERGVGWMFLSAGLTVVALYGAFLLMWEFLLDPAVPIVLRLGVALAVAGALILLVSIGRERYHAYRYERYEREVEL